MEDKKIDFNFEPFTLETEHYDIHGYISGLNPGESLELAPNADSFITRCVKEGWLIDANSDALNGVFNFKFIGEGNKIYLDCLEIVPKEK